jgi:aldehyde dehydrogenase (NAD+)
LFINNELIASKSKNRFATYNPATEEVIAEVFEALAEDVDVAVKAARAALPIWKKVPPKERYLMLHSC